MYLPRTAFLITLLSALALSGCVSTQPVKYQGLASTHAMTTSEPDKTNEHAPFSYVNPEVVWQNYATYMLDPIEIYANPDGQFGKLNDSDKDKLASYMHDQFVLALSKKFEPSPVPTIDTLRIHITLTGVETSTRVVSTMTKVIPVGAVVNTALWAFGKQAAFTGSVTYAVEIYDAATGDLLDAYITKQYPGAMNIPASFSSLGAAKAGIRLGAKRLTNTLSMYGVVGSNTSSTESSHP